MGIDTSRPQRSHEELFLPADTLRTCHPDDSCWCRTPHRRRRYIHVERGEDGRESWKDPFDFLDRFFTSGMYGDAFPRGSTGMMLGPDSMWPGSWKSPSEWTARDYDRLGEVLGEYLARERGKGMGRHTMDPGLGYQHPLFAMLAPWMLSASFPGDEAQPRRRHRYARQSDMEQMQEQLRSFSDLIFGSPAELKQDRFQARMAKVLSDQLPELLKQFIAQQNLSNPPASTGIGTGLGCPGVGPGMPNPMASSMPGMMGMPPFGAGPGMNPMNSMPGPGMRGMSPMGGMGGKGGMGGASGMGGGMGGMQGSGPVGGFDAMANGMNDFGNSFSRRHGMGGGGGRRRAFRNLGWDDDMDDDLGFGGGGGGGGGFGRRQPRRRRGPFDDDDDGFLGGFDGDGRRSPRGPPPAPPRRRPDGNGGGSGGIGGMMNGMETAEALPRSSSVNAQPQPVHTSPRPRASRPTRISSPHAMASMPPDRPLTPINPYQGQQIPGHSMSAQEAWTSVEMQERPPPGGIPVNPEMMHPGAFRGWPGVYGASIPVMWSGQVVETPEDRHVRFSGNDGAEAGRTRPSEQSNPKKDVP